MILGNGILRPDGDLPQVLSGLEDELLTTLAGPALEARTVIGACARLLDRLDRGELDALIARYATPQLLAELGEYRRFLRPEVLEARLALELGGLDGPRPFGRTEAHPLGVLLHVAAGNLDGLPAYTALEGLLTGNLNLVKLPSGDSGLSLALAKLLTDTEPQLAPYLYVFPIPSSDRASLGALARMANGIVTWGGDEAITALRALAPAGCRLIEWGHRLSFAYLSGEAPEADLTALARHILATNGLLCSSCQGIYVDTDQMEDLERFARRFLPILEGAARGRTPGQAALSALHGWEHRLELAADGSPDRVLPGRGCSLTVCADRALELSPLYGNVWVKALPRRELVWVLGPCRGRLQTAGLLCPPEERAELTALLARAGVNRITAPGRMSTLLPGEAHDGEYPLRRYLRAVDIADR